MDNRPYAIRFENMGGDKKSGLSERLKEEIALQRDKNFYSGIAMGTVENRVKSVLDRFEDVDKAKFTYPVTRAPEKMFMCVIAKDAFTDVKELTEELYTKTFGIRRRYATKSRNLPHAIDNFPELEEMRAVQPEKTCQIEKQAYNENQTDPRKEFSRLRIIGETYRAIIDKLSIHASDIAQYATSIYDPGREEVQPYLPDDEGYLEMLRKNDMLIATASHWKQFKATLNQMNLLIEESDDIILTDIKPGNSEINLYSTIEKVARTARLCYQSTLLRRSHSEIKLFVEQPDDDITLITNKAEIRQALLMMLLDKMYILRDANDGTVNIGYRKEDAESVTIYVRDNGPQIEEEDPNILLERCKDNPVETMLSREYFNIAEVRRLVEPHRPVLNLFKTEPTGIECQLTLQIQPTT